MRTRAHILLSILALLVGACADDGLSRPTDDTPAAGLARQAFRLTIDLRGGGIDVAAPSAARAAAGTAGRPTFSLIGHDGVAVTAGPCTFSPVPRNPRRKRCTFSLEIENRLDATDLVTPTDFPKPAAGLAGVLAFPLSAAALGGTDPTVVPSPDWDEAPFNLFNDFGGCSSGGKSDCYRSEAFGSPMYAGASESRTVGFDVPIEATSATAYIAVAADLRDNPVRTVHLSAEPGLTGSLSSDGDLITGESFVHARQTYEAVGGTVPTYRGFVSFRNALPQTALVRSAELHVYYSGGPSSFTVYTVPYAEPLDFGSTLEAEDYDLAPLGPLQRMQGSPVDDRFRAYFLVQVQLWVDTRTEHLQFRLPPGPLDMGFYDLEGTDYGHRPELVVAYTLR